LRAVATATIPEIDVILKDFAGAVNAALPGRFGEDIRHNVRAAVRAAVESMDLVTREELEVQRQVLLRTRQKVDALEARVAELEHRLAAASDDAT
jgi:ubiquinone biosynthesis accessory factor UbiK